MSSNIFCQNIIEWIVDNYLEHVLNNGLYSNYIYPKCLVKFKMWYFALCSSIITSIKYATRSTVL